MGLNEFGLSEAPAIEVFQDIGYEFREGGEIAPEGESPERDSYSDVVLRGRLRGKLEELNPSVPNEAIQQAVSALLGFASPRLLRNNRDFHEKLVNGVQVEYERDGEQVGDFVRVVDFDEPGNNDFLVVNQFSVSIGDNPTRRPDLVVFLNGLPIGVFEFKDPTNQAATIRDDAYRQVAETYVRDVPDLFHYNEFIAVMDKNNARVGCLGANWEWYSLWNYVEEEGDVHPDMAPSEVLIRGLFDQERMLDAIRNFVVFGEEDGVLSKKLAAYHQFYAVRRAVDGTLETVPDPDDNRIGVFWHTQGSGKSLSMVFYTKKARRLPELQNPTFVVLTDRQALDAQIEETFTDAGFRTFEADDGDHLRELLEREAGGVIFTLIQKFRPREDESVYKEINDRRNVIVIADEAHRTQYKKLAENVRRALPNASYLGFTATPIELEDRSTYATFGDYISTYPIDQSERDGSTVPIYYESRMAKLHLDDAEIEEEFEELMESESDDLKNEMIKRWSALRNLVENHDERLRTISKDIVGHYLNRDLEGKAMVVAISRKAAVKYKDYIQEALDERGEDIEAKVVITGPEEFGEEKVPDRTLKKRFKDIDDPFRISVVCEKWTTGFDVPHLHTMYLDRPMKNHNLLQAIGRVNRVYKDKPGGLLVDYIGIGDNLKKALDRYTSDIQQQALTDLSEAIALMKRKHEEVSAFFRYTEYENWYKEESSLKLQRLIHQGENEVLESRKREEEFKQALSELDSLYSLISPHSEALEIRTDLVYFRAVRDSMEKLEGRGDDDGVDRKRWAKLNSAMKELVEEKVSVEDLVDLAEIQTDGIERAVLSDEFLREVEGIEYENLQEKLLEKVLRNEISRGKKRNKARYESFEEKLEETVNKYNNNFLTTSEVIEKLKAYAEELQEERRRGERIDLSDEELAFYDAIASEFRDMPKEELKEIAREVKRRLQDKAEIDWTHRMQMKAQMKSEVKKVLRKRGFSHSEYEPIVDPIVEQAEIFYG